MSANIFVLLFLTAFRFCCHVSPYLCVAASVFWYCVGPCICAAADGCLYVLVLLSSLIFVHLPLCLGVIVGPYLHAVADNCLCCCCFCGHFIHVAVLQRFCVIFVIWQPPLELVFGTAVAPAFLLLSLLPVFCVGVKDQVVQKARMLYFQIIDECNINDLTYSYFVTFQQIVNNFIPNIGSKLSY